MATGNVEITHGAARLMADRVEMNRDTGDAVAQGRVVFYDGENQLTGRRVDYNLKTGTGVVYNAEARAAPYYRISGERMDRVGESVYEVQQGRLHDLRGRFADAGRSASARPPPTSKTSSTAPTPRSG